MPPESQTILTTPPPVHPTGKEVPWRRWENWALVIWFLVIGVILARTWIKPTSNSVYPIYAQAARNWLVGQEMYAPQPHLDVYRYSPTVAAVLVPFGILPDFLGNVLWRLLNLAVFVGALIWWLRLLTVDRPLTATQYGLYWLLLLPLAIPSINNGQCNVLVLGLILMALAATFRERWNLAALCLAGTVLFKVYPLALGMLLCLVYPRQLTLRLVLAILLGLLLPFCLQELNYVLGQYSQWIEHLRESDWKGFTAYRDFWVFIQWLGLPLDRGDYLVLKLLTAGGAAGLCLAASWRSWPRPILLTMLLDLGCLWMVLFGPATESCTYTFLAPTLAWILVHSWHADCPPRTRIRLVAIFGLFVMGQITCWFPLAHESTLALKPLAGLLLLLEILGRDLPRFRLLSAFQNLMSKNFPRRFPWPAKSKN